MKNANEIAQMTITATKKIAAERHDRTMSYINNIMCREIEKMANNGEIDVKFKVSTNVDRETIERVFIEHGFDVTVKGYEVRISWFQQYLKNRT